LSTQSVLPSVLSQPAPSSHPDLTAPVPVTLGSGAWPWGLECWDDLCRMGQ
jgi:hypothetical protein